jgi:hypothetical protein
VVFAGNQNGRTAWRVKDGAQTYGQWQEQKLEEAGKQKEQPALE